MSICLYNKETRTTTYIAGSPLKITPVSIQRQLPSKCDSCGAPLVIKEDKAVCEYCGTEYT